MKKVQFIFLSIFFLVNSNAQELFKHIRDQNKLIGKIKNNDSWETIYQCAQKELDLSGDVLNDISRTIKFKSEQSLTPLDNFFHHICDSVYSSFPYRKSGYLTNELYLVKPPDTSEIGIFIRGIEGKNLYPQIAELLQLEENLLLPQLIEYLKNDAATRLCFSPFDWDEAPYYLSVSDMAMEIIEIKTYCDFFDNASFSNKLYSNLNHEERKLISDNISEWFIKTQELNGSNKVVYFLDSICNLDHSYRFTCHNLLFSGDTPTAKKMYKKFYDTLSLPCRKEWEIGKILLSLGDRTVIEDCMNTSINYSCMVDSGIKCVSILLESEEAYSRDDFLEEIISTEPISAYRRSGSGPIYIWHKIFGEISVYDKYKMPKTLVALMSITNDFNEISSTYTYKWKNKYPDAILKTYRVCDLALLKYNETIEKVNILNWDDIQERDRVIKSIKLKYAD